MKTLAQFKQEQNITSIELMQGKGRKFATVRDMDLIVGTKTDLKQPLFVIPLSKAIDAALPISEENSVIVPKAFVLINNANVKAVM